MHRIRVLVPDKDSVHFFCKGTNRVDYILMFHKNVLKWSTTLEPLANIGYFSCIDSCSAEYESHSKVIRKIPINRFQLD